jgi:hypothetical protein
MIFDVELNSSLNRTHSAEPAECFDPCAFEQGLPDYRRRLYCYRAHGLDDIQRTGHAVADYGSALILAGVWFINIASEEIESRV